MAQVWTIEETLKHCIKYITDEGANKNDTIRKYIFFITEQYKSVMGYDSNNNIHILVSLFPSTFIMHLNFLKATSASLCH